MGRDSRCISGRVAFFLLFSLLFFFTFSLFVLVLCFSYVIQQWWYLGSLTLKGLHDQGYSRPAFCPLKGRKAAPGACAISGSVMQSSTWGFLFLFWRTLSGT